MYYGDDMETVKVSQKFQVVIPKAIRRVLKIKPGEQMVMIEKGGIVHMVPISDIRKAKGLAKGITPEGLRDESERLD